MELSAKSVNSLELITNSAKSPIPDVWMVSATSTNPLENRLKIDLKLKRKEVLNNECIWKLVIYIKVFYKTYLGQKVRETAST